MKAMKSLLVAAVAAGGLAAVDVQAQVKHGGARVSGGHVSGGHHWSGGHWGGHRWWGPSVGFYIGAPILWGSWYWGYPYDYYWPRTVIVERGYPGEVMREREVAPSTTEVPRGDGAPTQAPAYRNYCDSAKAYFPKVTRCPEGWRFEPAR